MKLSAVFNGTLTAVMIAGCLCAFASISLSPAQSHAEQLTQPRLLWERAFEKDILAVGIDKAMLPQTGGDFSKCLKWIVFDGWTLGQFDGHGNLVLKPEIGRVYPFCVSADGRYYCASLAEQEWWKKEDGVQYTVFDWDGRSVWGFRRRFCGFPLMWNDACLVLPLATMDSDGIGGMDFFDASGKLTTAYRLSGSHDMAASSPFGVSERFFVLATYIQKEGGEICVFEKGGQLVWKQAGIESWYTNDRGERKRCWLGGAAVSHRGEVIVLGIGIGAPCFNILVYDSEGILKDTLSLYADGGLNALGTAGRLGLVSCSYHFLCYDFENMRTRFLLKGGEEHRFGRFYVDVQAGLIALHEEDGGEFVRIYDFDGVLKAEVRVESPRYRSDFWFRLLDGGLLTGERNKLRSYAVGRR